MHFFPNMASLMSGAKSYRKMSTALHEPGGSYQNPLRSSKNWAWFHWAWFVLSLPNILFLFFADAMLAYYHIISDVILVFHDLEGRKNIQAMTWYIDKLGFNDQENEKTTKNCPVIRIDLMKMTELLIIYFFPFQWQTLCSPLHLLLFYWKN